MKTGKTLNIKTNMYKILYSVYFLLVCSVGLKAQDIKTDLQKIKDVYEKKEYSTTIQYTYYNGAVKEEETTALHVFSKGNYYYKIDNIEVVKNNSCQLIVNHGFKTISILPPGNKDEYKEISKIPVDSSLKQVKSHTYKSINEAEALYTIELKKGKYKKMEIHFNKKSHQLVKLKFYISDSYSAADPDYANGILLVEFKSFKPSITAAEKKLINENRFVVLTSKNAKLVSTYNQYELNNYLNGNTE